MTRLQRMQRRLHDIRMAGGNGSIRYVNGSPFLVFTYASDPATTAAHILNCRPIHTMSAQAKNPTPA